MGTAGELSMKYKCGATYVSPTRELHVSIQDCIYTEIIWEISKRFTKLVFTKQPSMAISGSLVPDGLGPGSYMSALTFCFCLAVYSFSSWFVCF